MAEATIRDVAREAQLSVASVSRALNGHKSVRPETRARIVAVADRLGYVPHAGARSLSMARSNAIGVVLPDLHGEFFSELMRGIDQVARAHGQHLLVSSYHGNPEEQGAALRAMRGRVDGLLLMSPYVHDAEGPDDMPSHIRAALTSTTLSIPVVAGRAALGTWQGIYLYEHRRAPHRRTVVAHVIGE